MAPVRKGRIDLECPPDWRQGQTVVNFLRHLEAKGIPLEGFGVFYLEDNEWERLYREFLDEL